MRVSNSRQYPGAQQRDTPSTSPYIKYTRKRNGGLGFSKLNDVSAIASSFKSRLRFLGSPAFVRRALADGTAPWERLKRTTCIHFINLPILNLKTIDCWKIEFKRQKLERQQNQGNTTKPLADDPIEFCLLYNPTLLKPCQYLTTLKIRNNICANRVVLNRAVLQHNLVCQKCQLPETLAHVNGQCKYSKPQRKAKHNGILKLVKKHIVEVDEAAMCKSRPLQMGDNSKNRTGCQNHEKTSTSLSTLLLLQQPTYILLPQ